MPSSQRSRSRHAAGAGCAATVVVAVYYKIGFRVEPRNRTGFAHLFEHMMFQGSKNLGKMEFIRLVQRNGGILNGSTRFDERS